MTEPHRTGFVVECFWAGVTQEGLRALDAQADARARELTGGGEPVRCLGSILMCEDEVVLFLFEGDADSVRHAAEQAQIPFERIIASTHRLSFDAQ